VVYTFHFDHPEGRRLNPVGTAVLLIMTLLVVPVFSYFFGTPLGSAELDALHTLFTVLFLSVLVCFLLGEMTGNVSQVDKLWSLLPIVYGPTRATLIILPSKACGSLFTCQANKRRSPKRIPDTNKPQDHKTGRSVQCGSD